MGTYLDAIRYGRDGVPIVTGLRYDPVEDGGYSLGRWHLVESRALSVRFHHLRTSDRNDLHDHPWDYVTTLLTGAYIEHTEEGAENLYRAPCTLVRRAEWAHRLELAESPCWTLLVAGPVRNHWGFFTDRGWVPWREHTRASAEPSRQW